MVFKQFPISHSAALPKFLSSRLLVVKEFQILKQAAKCRISNLSQIFQNFTFFSAQPFCKSCQNIPYKPKPDIPKFHNFFLLSCSATQPFCKSYSNLSQVFPYFTIFPALPLSHSAVLQKPPQMVISLKNDGISNLRNDISKFYHFFCSAALPLSCSAKTVRISLSNLSQIFPHFTIFLLCHSATLPFSCFAKAPLSNGDISQK